MPTCTDGDPGPDSDPGPDRSPDPPSRPAGRSRRRRWAAALGTGLAATWVFLALVAPRELDQFSPAALVRIPVEALVGAAVLVALPPRPRQWAAGIGGAVLGLLTVLKILDLGFVAAWARPFDPVLDLVLLGDGVTLLAGSVGVPAAVSVVLVAGLLAVGLPVLTALSARRLARIVARHRRTSTRLVAVLAVGWLTCAVSGAQLAPPVPIAARSGAALAYHKALQVPADIRDRAEFTAQVGVDAHRDTPPEQLLAGLRGKDVVLAFVESYGRSAVEEPEFATQVDAVLDDGSRRLAAAGFGARSAYLTSPTAGGGSWLAHATLLSGLWVDNQRRYDDLHATDRLTLTSAFGRAGWRTVGVMPGNTTADWPDAAFYGYHQVYDAADLDAGADTPAGFAALPDQYTLDAFERLERSRPDRAPVMAEIPLVSSHAPWSPIPRLLSWDRLADGPDAAAGPALSAPELVARDVTQLRADYRRTIEYSLGSLVSYVAEHGDDDLVLVFVGDHQPAPVITGDGATRDVPITIVARDPAVLDRAAGWGWQPGLRPGPRSPVWPMDTFRDRFLDSFSDAPTERRRPH